jgi:AcrR family transcriptional regulator
MTRAAHRALTMVRERSGVGKATLYRRHGSKEELVKAAIVRPRLPAEVVIAGGEASGFGARRGPRRVLAGLRPR